MNTRIIAPTPRHIVREHQKALAHTHKDTHRHTKTHTDTQTHTQTYRHTKTHTDTHRHTKTHTDTDTQTHTQTQTYTQRHNRHTKTHTRIIDCTPRHIVGEHQKALAPLGSVIILLCSLQCWTTTVWDCLRLRLLCFATIWLMQHLHNLPSTVVSIFKQLGQQKAPHMEVACIHSQFFQMLQSDDAAKVGEKCRFMLFATWLHSLASIWTWSSQY